MFRRPFTVLGAAVAVCLALTPRPASAQVNVSGAWEVSMTTPQGPTTVDVSFVQQGEAITGELTSPLGTAPFKGTIKGSAMAVVVPIDVQGTSLELTFTATATNDKLSGTVKFGDLGEAPFEGKRKAGATAAPAAARPSAASGINGDWNLVIDLQGNQIPATATFAQEGGKVTGTIASEQGSMAVSGTITGNALSLEFTAPGDMAVTMNGTVGPNGLSGKMSVAGFGDGDWTGKRK